MSMKKKTPYETPVILPLGELARGSGICSNGSQVSTGGGSPQECTSGPNANSKCFTGNNAQQNNICTMGKGATGTCANGPQN